MAASRLTEQLGRVLGGRYRLVAPIGRGASAAVYLADDVTLKRRVAVKVLHPALADDEAFLRRFRAEARAAAALSHPNIMAVYDWGEDDGPYLVLEFLGGGSLRAMLDRGRRLSTSQAVVVGLEAARALDAAHQRGFVHRDIKPANLLFGDDGRLRIADFGLARALSEAAWTDPGDTIVGTARYAAPEQASGGGMSGKADVYALGLVIQEATTRTVPLTSDTALGTLLGRVDRPVPVPDSLGPLVPILRKAGLPDPDLRPDAAELARGLLAAARSLDRPEPLPLAGAIDLTTLTVTDESDPTLLPDRNRATTTGGTPVVVDERSRPPVVVKDKPRRRRRRRVRAPGHRRRRWPWVVLSVLLFSGAGGAAWAWYQSLPPSAEVPAVEGRTEREAMERLEAAQAGSDEALEWSIVDERRYNDNVRRGAVINQRPDAGTDLDDGGTVTIVVSRGPRPTTVPDLQGKSKDAAEMLLAEARLEEGDVTFATDELIPPGSVVNWLVDGRERPVRVPRGTEVDLVLSSGPQQRLIPDLRGRPADQARAELEAQGLVVQTSGRFSSDLDEGLVIGSEPGAGATADRGSTVTLLVSRGADLVTVPDVEGMRLQRAVRLVREAGLVPDQVLGPAENGVVARIDFEPGERVERGTSVDFFMRRRQSGDG